MKQIFIFLTLICNLFCFGQNGTYQVTATANPSFTNLLLQINAIGATDVTININKTLTLTSSITIPSNIGLKFYKGAVIKLNGFTLTINGSIDAGVFQIFSGTGIVNGKPKIERSLPQWFKEPNSNFNDDIDWSPAIQKAVDFYPKVLFPEMNIAGGFKESENAYHIRSTIKLDVSKSGIVLTGFGTESILTTYLTRQSTYGNFKGYVFECINSSTENDPFRNGLIIENLTVFCDNGIKVSLIDISDFTNISGQQNQNNIISRVKINGCKFINHQTDRSFNAISMVKVFDSEISNNYIQGFTTGILLEGCDLNTIRDNNVINFSKYAICDLAFGDFGSQNTIVHNDLLDFRGSASDKGSFIKSNSRHIIIRDNYLESNEQAHQLFAYIDCSKVGLPARDNYTNFSKQIDITGNRCDIQSNNCTKYMFYINEKFKSLNLNEIPNLNTNFTNGSSFGQDTNEELPIDYIRMKIIDTENWDKVINMQNCESFKNWKNFSTSKQFSQGSNGDIIIDSKNISYVSNRGDYLCQKFNPRSFLLEPGNSIFIKIDQKNDGLLGDLFKNVTFKVKIRNLSDTTDNSTNDIYFAIKTTTTSANFTPPLFYVSPIDIPSDKNYSIIKINTPNSFTGFDPTENYYIQIHGANSIKEIKEIIIENKQPVIANVNKNSLDENLKDKHNENLKINPNLEDSNTVPLTEKETTRTLTVKVDNSIVAFPNPVKSNLTIDIKDGDTIKSIEIFSEIGTFIKDFTNELSNNTIDISALPNATYLVKIVTLSSTTKVILKD